MFRSALTALLLAAVLPACAPTDEVVAGTTLSAPTAPWFYADFGDAIDWSSLRVEDADPSFRTLGGDLGSGVLSSGDTLAASLACDTPTRLTVALIDGVVDEVWTHPASRCVARAARAMDWSAVPIGAMLVGDVTHAILVLDVPAPSVARVSP